MVCPGEQFVDPGEFVAGVQTAVFDGGSLQQGQGFGMPRRGDQDGGPGLAGPGPEAGGIEYGGGFLQLGAQPLRLVQVPEG